MRLSGVMYVADFLGPQIPRLANLTSGICLTRPYVLGTDEATLPC